MFDAEFLYTKPDPLALDFNPPIKTATGELARLVLQEPTANAVWVAEQHLIARNGTRGTRMYQKALVAKVGGVPEAILDEVPIGTFTKAARYLQDFVEAGLPDAASDDGGPMPPSFLIVFNEPIANLSALTLHEPTLGQMAKAEALLGDMSPQRVRAYQETLMAMSSGESSTLVTQLPISVLNRAASYVLGFSAAGRAIAS